MKPIIGIFEPVEIEAKNGKRIHVTAKIDTGAFRVSLDKELAENVGISSENFLRNREIKSALGKERRAVYTVIFYMKGQRIESEATITPRSHLRFPMLIGRKYIKDFLIDPSK
jgi:hypothetical protein